MSVGLAGSCRGGHREPRTVFDALRNYSPDDVLIIVIVIVVVMLLLWFVFVQGTVSL